MSFRTFFIFFPLDLIRKVKCINYVLLGWKFKMVGGHIIVSSSNDLVGETFMHQKRVNVTFSNIINGSWHFCVGIYWQSRLLIIKVHWNRSSYNIWRPPAKSHIRFQRVLSCRSELKWWRHRCKNLLVDFWVQNFRRIFLKDATFISCWFYILFASLNAILSIKYVF